MRTVFADTFFFLAILNPSDSAHKRAAELSRSLHTPRVTTSWVLTEVGDALASHNRQAFLDLMQLLGKSPLMRVVEPSQELFTAGIGLYGMRSDKDWPLTDCISFVVMEREGIRDAMTGDRHFEQAGFIALLK
jgi:predicted nucleic acid-binding protein